MVQYFLHLRVAQPFQFQHKEAYDINHIQIHATYATVTFSVHNFRCLSAGCCVKTVRRYRWSCAHGNTWVRYTNVLITPQEVNAFLQLEEQVAINLCMISTLFPHYTILIYHRNMATTNICVPALAFECICLYNICIKKKSSPQLLIHVMTSYKKRNIRNLRVIVHLFLSGLVCFTFKCMPYVLNHTYFFLIT